MLMQRFPARPPGARDATAGAPWSQGPRSPRSPEEVIVERYLERIIGRMIDVNYHLIAEAGQAPPRDYHESSTGLAKLGILPGEFVARIAACAGLRYRIVREYDDIDPELVHAALQAAVCDIPEYLRHVERHLERSVAEE
jgi:uncharacterized protein YutE (UPF0331/DUF86 family)